ncbi:MAG: hypothetical protein V1898_03525 [Patescibacteria group bacterium]
MSGKKSNNSNKKSGLYVILFIVMLGLIFVYYSKNTSSVNNNNNININSVNNVNDTQSSNENNAGNENVNSSDNLKVNSNVNVDAGGEPIARPQPNTNIIIRGYDNIRKTGTGEIETLDLGGGNTISIMPQELEGMVRSSLGAIKEEHIVVAGKEAVRLTGESAKDGSSVTFVLLKNQDKLYHFKGADAFIDNLNNIIEFNN